jgi:hypothetical protein
MGRIEIVVPRAYGEADFSGFTLKWLSAFKMDKMVIRGRLPIHLQEAPKLSKEWGEGQDAKKGVYQNEKIVYVVGGNVPFGFTGMQRFADGRGQIQSAVYRG